MALADQALILTDPAFQQRVKAAMLAVAMSVTWEATSVIAHSRRLAFAGYTLQNPEIAMLIGANAASQDTNCIADATAGGTVTLTTGNLAAQCALITDAHINSFITNNWNSFLGTASL